MACLVHSVGSSGLKGRQTTVSRFWRLELPFLPMLRYSDKNEIGEAMITLDILTEYVRRIMPDAAVTVSDRTGTMDHLKVVVVSTVFAGKNLLDRHRMIYQALDVPMKDGRIHALELTAKTTDEV